MKRLLIVLSIVLICFGSVFAQGAKEDAPPKIGFLVKMPEEPWFQNEWKFADEAGKALGFDVVKIGTTDGEKVLSAIDNLQAQGAGGFVICTPDVRLGPSIMAKAKAYGMKVISVDDQFVDASGKAMTEVPHMGISAYEIGKQVGYTLHDQMVARGWDPAKTGFMRISFNELPTALDRTTGMTDALIERGFSAGHVFESPEKTTDTEGGFNAANITITKNPEIRHWLVGGLNDEAAMGGTRALEGNGFLAKDICAVGIGGSGTATVEFQKKEATGFYATALISPKRHGYETSELLFNWITKGVEPPKTTWTTAVMMDRSNYVQKMKENE
ncbi:MAG: arabinose ABC transporter substrate-binding protein [Sphaerochaeta sp.]|nr:arabinose ABC transporter substrate-binding protein [Sphaerochaeta sp.]MDY0287915.1 arabinose ABC transporter substrate-binding protein [Sphaerochaeta sp.]